MRALFLDVGETLVYAHPSSAEVMAAVCAEGGLEVDVGAVEEAEARVSAPGPGPAGGDARGRPVLPLRRQLGALLALGLRRHPRRPGRAEGARADLAQAIHDRFSALETWRLYPDALPLLGEIERRRREGLVVGVVSNWEDWLEALLVSLEVHHYFDFLVVSAGVRWEKPDPAIFRAALAGPGWAPRRRCTSATA